MYGTTKPFNYGDNYDIIDIPITYFISMDDFLIRADDVLRHYEALRRKNPKLAFVKVFKGLGHCDFNYKPNDQVSLALQTYLKKV